ncbi:MAG: rod shape-determining protein RodA [Candidatus Saccharimonadales bacterium]
MLKKFDLILLASVLLLTVIGLVVLHAINVRDPSLLQGFNPTVQLVAAMIGLIGLVVAARIDYRLLMRIAPAWYGVGLALLAIVLLIGETVSGSIRSIEVGFFEFQPTEIAKLGLIVMLARYFAYNRRDLIKIRYFVGSLLILGAVAALIMLQPDLGSVMVMAAIWFLMAMMSGTRRLFLVLFVGVALAVLPLATQLLEPYQQARLETFFNPAADPQGQGYNVNQAIIAVGSGQLFGRGLGGGTQSTLNFLPSQHTDFIFAVVAEKLGLLGAGLVLVLFGVVIWRGVRIAWQAQDRFGAQLSTGIVAMLLVQVVITVGMNLGIAPVTGLPLPFIAYGGTNLVISLFAIGILQSIVTHNQTLQFKQ